MARRRQEDVLRVIAKKLACPQSLPGLGGNDNSSNGGSLGSNGDGNGSGGCRVSSG